MNNLVDKFKSFLLDFCKEHRRKKEPYAVWKGFEDIIEELERINWNLTEINESSWYRIKVLTKAACILREQKGYDSSKVIETFYKFENLFEEEELYNWKSFNFRLYSQARGILKNKIVNFFESVRRCQIQDEPYKNNLEKYLQQQSNGRFFEDWKQMAQFFGYKPLIHAHAVTIPTIEGFEAFRKKLDFGFFWERENGK